MHLSRKIKTLMLGTLTTISGVFVACAYGTRYAWSGIVQDAETKEPIPGLEVAGVVDGTKPDPDRSYGNGDGDGDG
ncbi:MAG: hypothetical protein V2A73_20690, partial [Pseudomonadota bacterium]